jgi:predicted short-subunit dehydrogenase-like oxidoreductase (DUF2520 family)
MRQVPHYLIIGNGRVARHFQFYFSNLNLSYSSWHRSEPDSKLQEQINHASHISSKLKNRPQLLIHFSGSLITNAAYGTHPLMTFSESLYPKNQYQTIPFIIDQDAPPFEEIFPGLTNPHFRLSKELKAKYHALCVLSGNFSCMLWQKLIATFENEFNFDPEIAHPYLIQQTQNILNNYKTALSGPLTRNDFHTIKNNLASLDSDPFQNVYKSFVECYQTLQKDH